MLTFQEATFSTPIINENLCLHFQLTHCMTLSCLIQRHTLQFWFIIPAFAGNYQKIYWEMDVNYWVRIDLAWKLLPWVHWRWLIEGFTINMSIFRLFELFGLICIFSKYLCCYISNKNTSITLLIHYFPNVKYM